MHEIPERSTSPPTEHILGYCFHCSAEIYEGDDIWIDQDNNWILDDHLTEDCKRFYKYKCQAERDCKYD